MIDAMRIKRSVLYDNSKGCYVGFSDYGNDLLIGEPDKTATEA